MRFDPPAAVFNKRDGCFIAREHLPVAKLFPGGQQAWLILSLGMAGDVNKWIGEGAVEIGGQKQFERRHLTSSFDGELDFHRGRVWPTIDRTQFEGTFRFRGPVDFDGLIVQKAGG